MTPQRKVEPFFDICTGKWSAALWHLDYYRDTRGRICTFWEWDGNLPHQFDSEEEALEYGQKMIGRVQT